MRKCEIRKRAISKNNPCVQNSGRKIVHIVSGTPLPEGLFFQKKRGFFWKKKSLS